VHDSSVCLQTAEWHKIVFVQVGLDFGVVWMVRVSHKRNQQKRNVMQQIYPQLAKKLLQQSDGIWTTPTMDTTEQAEERKFWHSFSSFFGLLALMEFKNIHILTCISIRRLGSANARESRKY